MTKREAEAYIEGAYKAHRYPRLDAGDLLVCTRKGERYSLACVQVTEDEVVGGKEFTFDNGVTLYEIEYFNNIDLWRSQGYKVEVQKEAAR